MADTLEIDAVQIIDTIADQSTDLKTVAALREAQTALKRLSAIKAQHHRYEKTTDGGTVVYPSIHGFRLHELLYGDPDAL